MTVCGEKVTGVCAMGKCPHFKRCCPVVWDKYGKIKPKTNEEWLRSCTTDEMVKMILDLCDDRPCFACGIGYCDDENWCHVYSDEAKEFVMKWLKEKHNEMPKV